MNKANESQVTEWKESWRDEYLKWICGFANAQGGRLIIGKNDKGNTVGLENIDKLMEDIPNKARDILGIMVDVNMSQEKGLLFIEIIVEQYPYPVSYKGQYHYRSGSTKQELKGAALDKFLLQKQGKTWDGVPVPGVKVEEFSNLELFRKSAANSKRLDEHVLQDDDETLIDKLRLFDGSYLKRAALLLFHPDPEKYVSGAFVKIGFFESDSELLYQDEIHGNLFKQANKTVDILATKYLKARIFYEGIYRHERSPVPRDALREAILNAVVHKDYSSNIPIQISVYENKLMIWNSGHLHEGWTVEKLLQKHASVPFNPDIANAFFRAGLIEAWGRGIEKIYAACKRHGYPEPVISIEEGGVWIRFDFEDKVKTSIEKLGNQLGNQLGNTRMKILDTMKNNPKVTGPKLAEMLGMSTTAIEKNIKYLRENGHIKRVGGTRGHWEVNDE